ncbi:MAG: protein translocase subunit SecD [Bdellovibrionota bacterium]
MESYRLRMSLGLVGLALAFIWVLPNLVNVENIKWLPHDKLNYGLDIQGGLHLVMGVDVTSVVSESTVRLVASLKKEFENPTVGITIKDVTASNPGEGEITIMLASAADNAKLEKHMNDIHGTVLQSLKSTDNTHIYRYFDAYLTDYKNRVIQQSIETLRNRIDEFGVAEPSISQQGPDRIMIQLPGVADAEKAKQLINTTAKLDFMMLSEDPIAGTLPKLVEDAEKAGKYSMATMKYSEYIDRLNKDIAGKLPPQTIVYFQKRESATKMEMGGMPFLLKTDTGLGGEALDDAHVSFGQYGEPEVALKFNLGGTAKFGDLTGNNIGKSMAIVLDRVVKSAPRIQTKIADGNARITMGGRDRNNTMEEAKMISTALRAGALPARLEQLEERRVGPSLGADSLQKAKVASLVGAMIIILFMLFYYKAMGVIATLTLGVNIFSVFALLTNFGATLTLPGIAGLALTVGFAVDANVLIHERIKDELRAGTSWKLAIQEGYAKAMSAILDSNITTAATATVLLYFGTGPVKGFAVTLLIGIATTLFANVFLSKLIVDTLVNKFKFQKLSV